MDWIQFLQIICVPAFGWFFYKLGEQRKEIKLLERGVWGFKVAVAKEFGAQVIIMRVEARIEVLHQLLWEMHNEHTTRHKK